MFPNRNDGRCRAAKPVRALLYLLLLLGAGPAHSEIMLLEDPFASMRPPDPGHHALTLGSEYFSAHEWIGLRSQFRYEASRGHVVGWAITLPWLYSQLDGIGHGGRDNLRLSGNLRVWGEDEGRLRFGAEFWVPFAGDGLLPLAQRRAFSRFSLMSLTRSDGLLMRAALAYRRELSGLGGEVEGVWAERWSAHLRLFSDPAENGPFLFGGVSASPEDISWGYYGLGWRSRLFDFSGLELALDRAWGAHESDAVYDWRLSIRITRAIFRPERSADEGEDGVDDVLEDSPVEGVEGEAGSSPAGETPPAEGVEDEVGGSPAGETPPAEGMEDEAGNSPAGEAPPAVK